MKETKAKKTAKRIGLDPKGINKLEKIMLANGKYFYNQCTFGALRKESDEPTHICGTELCAAGFARLLNVGAKKLATEVKHFMACTDDGTNSRYPKKCNDDGRVLLDISGDYGGTPEIFMSPSEWPYDLCNRFESLDGKPMAQVRCYIKMLRTRANSDGSLTHKGNKRY